MVECTAPINRIHVAINRIHVAINRTVVINNTLWLSVIC